MAQPTNGTTSLPRTIAPMRAISGEMPDSDDWAYEVKWDGVRAIGFIENGQLRLQSSNGNDITSRYPEVAPIAQSLVGRSAILDGEIVAFNDNGRPDFGLLQSRMHLKNVVGARDAAVRTPVVWVLFDLLHLDGHDLYTTQNTRPAPGGAVEYEDRRRLLESLIDPGPNWQVPKASRSDGASLLTAIAAKGMEGLVAKRLGATYEIGRRSPNWVKIKIRRRQEFVVGGWRPGEGARSGVLGALLVGYHTPQGELAYAGRVGSGFSEVELARVTGRLEAIEVPDCPFRIAPTRTEALHARWVQPLLVVEVAFTEWSHDDRLRQPSYLGQRNDKAAVDVVREPP